MDEVGERLRPVDLDDGDPRAVAGLELGIAVDRDLLEVERHLVVHGPDDRARGVAEVASRGTVEADAVAHGRRYG